MAYTHNTPATHAGSLLNIAANKSLLNAIVTGYKTNNFAKKLTKDINMGSIEGATLTNNLLYVSCRLVIPQDLKVRELLYNLAHDMLGHFSFDKSYESLRGSYYWPNMHRDLENAYIPSCTECQRNKNCTLKPTAPTAPTAGA
jgi:hypothetical protein